MILLTLLFICHKILCSYGLILLNLFDLGERLKLSAPNKVNSVIIGLYDILET